MDYHSSTNQLVSGGFTGDNGITSNHASTVIPLIVMYSGTSFTFSWGIYVLTSSWDYVLSISIS